MTGNGFWKDQDGNDVDCGRDPAPYLSLCDNPVAFKRHKVYRHCPDCQIIVTACMCSIRKKLGLAPS